MADVEMPDAGPSAPAKSKAPATKSANGADAGTDGKKRFEVKKWNAVALWAWDIVVDNCAICRNHIMDLCMLDSDIDHRTSTDMIIKASNVKQTKLQLRVKSAQWLGASATMLSTSTASHAGLRLDKFALLTTETGNSRNMGDKTLLNKRKACWRRLRARSQHQNKNSMRHNDRPNGEETL